MSDFDFGNLESSELGKPFDPAELARWGQRAVALLIDLLLSIGVFLIPTIVLFAGAAAVGDDDAGSGAVAVLALVGYLAATVWSLWFFGYRQGITGTTPGKRQQGLRLVDAETGRPPGGARGVGRWLVPGLINTVVGVYSIIDYLWPLWDVRNQRVTDKMFRTLVVGD